MRRKLAILVTVIGVLAAGCTQKSVQEPAVSTTTEKQSENDSETQALVQEHTDGSHILIAYFTRLDNTDAEIDEILQGGGPYGSLGTSLEDADLDAVASASIQVIDGEVQGTTEVVARMIQENIGGDLFSIQAEQTYPTDYDTLIDQGGEEKNQEARPELKSHVSNMQEYDIVFLGFPNWWYDMPMPLYSFLEEYDFSGKTVIPFVTSASSGFSGTVDTIQKMLPEAAIMKDGFQVRMGDVAGAKADVDHWIAGLDIFQ